nr:hypothetical protein [Komagataeibacter europaeus]
MLRQDAQGRMHRAPPAQGGGDGNVMQVPAIRPHGQVVQVGIQRGRSGHAPWMA